ncbi:MAG: hypothetical protein E8D46_07955 [Nitrospira sp.]|nr:hypothetical protein [Nitrospira sp.]TKB73812.1 MAG: hypothetical protein E8D46_07955 [Nitrospira sp.]
MSFTLYPLNLSGQIYGSPMPFGLFDPDGKLLHDLKAVNISAIVLLAEIEECREKTGRDLLSLYRGQGLTVFPLPTPNYGVPSNGQLVDVLKQTRTFASEGHNILIHCSAGLGRTALFAALLAKHVLGLSGAAAIEWLARHKPDALLTPAQIILILT